MSELIALIAAYGALGGVYGVSGYVHAVLDGEKDFDPVKFTKTVAIGAIAGAVVAVQGDELTPGAVEAIMAGLIPIVDQLANGITDE
jgi:hypothetical protein